MSASIKNSDNELMVIHQKLNEQSQELNELRQALTSLRANGNGHHQPNGGSFLETAESSALTDRRGMLKKVAGIAVGMATVGFLRPTSSSAADGKPISKTGAPSTNNDPWLVGTDEDATLPTGLHNTTTTLIATQLNVRNYGNVDFVQPSGTNIAVLGYANPAGGPANSNDIIGVWGEGRGSAGIGGKFVGDNAGIVIDAGRATLCLFSTTETFPPTSANFHTFGEVIVATDYTLWYTSDSPVQYRRLAGPGTAGAISLLASPKRLIDTRTGSGFFDAGGHYGQDTLRTYNIITIANNMTPGTLPLKTRAVVGRITVLNANGSGGLQESPNPPPGAGNDLGFGTAVINFPPATTLPAFGVPLLTALDSSGNIRVHSIMAAGGSVDVIIDITGYYI